MNIEDALQEIKILKRERDNFIDILHRVICQSCHVEDELGEDELDSFAIGSYADAMRLLEKYNKIRITSEGGRRVIAKQVISSD